MLLPTPVKFNVGDKVGKLTLLERFIKRESAYQAFWKCQCICGNIKTIFEGRLKRSEVTSCGPNCPTNLLPVGTKFGKLTLLESFIRNHKRWWICVCDCNPLVKLEIREFSLKSGSTKSCGCLRIEVNTVINTTHGGTHTRLYETWCGMWARCTNPNNKQFKDWGGRGITICKEWEDFAVFRDWASENGYKNHLTIERKNNNGNYCPENCTWIPKSEQAKNQRKNIKISAFGETKNLADWVRDHRCKVSYICLYKRLRKGINPEEAMSND